MFLALAMLGAFCRLVLGPCLEVHGALKALLPTSVVSKDEVWVREKQGAAAVKRLGGPERAAGKLAMYLRLPARVAKHRPGAAALLACCGHPGLPALHRALGDEDEFVRWSAVNALGVVGADPGEVGMIIPALNKMLADSSPKVRRATVWAINSTERRGKLEAVRSLIRALGDSEALVREAAAVGLSSAQLQAKDLAAPALIRALGDPDTGVRCAIIEALSNYGNWGVEAVAALEKILDDLDGDESVREAARSALAALKADRSGGIRPLIKGLSSPDPNVRYYAANWLLSMGAEAHDAQASLSRALGDSDRRVQVEAAWALVRIKSASPQAVSGLCKLLKDPEPRIRWLAAAVLKYVDPAPTEAIPALEGALKDESGEVREAAGESLRKIRGEEAKP